MAIDSANSPTVKVGILNSLSDSIAELPMRDAALLAIAEINAGGGVLGKAIEPVIRDSSAEPTKFTEQVSQLIHHDRVVAIFSGGSSQTRKAVIPLIDQADCSFWYPFAYEGLEQSQHVFYTGSCANQLLEPALKWLFDQQLTQTEDKSIFLLGDNTIFSRTTSNILKALLQEYNQTLAGEVYVLPWGTAHIDFAAIAQQVKQSKATVVFNLMSSFNTIDFYSQYSQTGVEASDFTIISLNLTEAELQQIDPIVAIGHYGCSSYFQRLDSKENQQFVQNFQAHYGADRVTSAPIETAYTQIYLWKLAAEVVGSFAPEQIVMASQNIDFPAPSGMIKFATDRHTHKSCRIGLVEPDGQLKLVYESDRQIEPQPWLGVTNTSSSLITNLLAQFSQTSATHQNQPASTQTEATYARELPLYTAQPSASGNEEEIDLLTLLAIIDEVILVFDRQGYCLQIAPTDPSYLVDHHQSQIGKSVYEVLPHKQAEMYHRFIQIALDRQTTQEIEYYLYINEQKTWFFARVSPISANRVAWIVRNITDYKHAETELHKITADLETEVSKRTQELVTTNKSLQSQIADRQHAEAELRALFRAITDVILVLDHEGRYLEVAPTNPDVLYLAPEEMLGRTIYEVMPKHKADELMAYVRKALRSQQTIPVEYSLEINDQEIWFAASISPMLENQVVWVARDITDRKQSEVMLKNAKEAIEKTYKARNVFLSTMSHELRTPLNAIIGYTEVLQEEVVEWGHEEIVEDLERIRTSGKHLLNLINDILDISRIEAGRVSLYLEDFDVRLLVDELASSIQMQAKKNNNKVVVSCAPDLTDMYGDLTKIRQCIYNLLSNACKFTHDGEITLSVYGLTEPIAEPARDSFGELLTTLQVSQTNMQVEPKAPASSASSDSQLELPQEHHGDRYLIFSVSDNGIGIEPERLPELFAPFTQADNSITRKYGGTGLGLAITNKICQFLGGKITVKSELGQGSTFTIQLPEKFNSSELEPGRSSFL
ncbi:PAS/PAC sensor signal transduction histidine kinase [Thalassoporum mexicanum PCC 7367]|uniref:transporter substrate-binding protein n=1 Tax=Thalassoporum mexicanum TaxID=3457544 RepID=UPI00029F9675|nr:transporter substrate-binding protein [Pseudanabaena sp. PCC 7367]AFY71610.1 PAS/PAC sensor signal transduction histidine kinase [Pseudanabaena sp. PCC 7367]